MKTLRIRHASMVLGLVVGALLAIACTAPSGGASGAPAPAAPSAAPISSPAPATPAAPADDYSY